MLHHVKSGIVKLIDFGLSRKILPGAEVNTLLSLLKEAAFFLMAVPLRLYPRPPSSRRNLKVKQKIIFSLYPPHPHVKGTAIKNKKCGFPNQ